MTSIMIVEDEFIVAQDLAVNLKNMGYSVYGSYESGESALQQIQDERPDLVMMDINLKGAMDGIQTAQKMNAQFDIPIIFLTAFANQKLLERAKIIGPVGYLIKPFTGKELQSAIEIGLYKAEIEKKLRLSEKRFRDMADLLPSVIVEFDPTQRITFINRAGMDLLILTDDDVAQGAYIGDFLPPSEHDKARERFAQVLSGSSIGSTEYQVVDKKGGEHTLIINSAPIREADAITGIRTSLVDISELKRLQLQVKQAWKMEAITTLAGGIAHEFNNALTGLIGQISMLKVNAPENTNIQTLTDNIMDSAERMGGLTNQMLAYARGGKYWPQPASLNDFVQKALEVVRQSLHSKVKVITELQNDVAWVDFDGSQFDFVFTALVKNASEAMENNGQIHILTKNITIDIESAKLNAGLEPGSYACLQVKDNGSGMGDEARQKIFEPFFSTKFAGRGMGMAAVYGIVKNHKGWIGIESKPGRGTQVSILLPVQQRR